MINRHVIASVLLLAALTSESVRAASGEMGTGVPVGYSMYSQATGTSTVVWSLQNASLAFPAGCTSITLTPATMGSDAYRIAVAAVMTANLAQKPIRFYAHATRDSGCGADMVQISN